MAIQWLSGRTFTCVAADTKPTTNVTTGTYALETDTFNFFRFNGTTYDKEESFAETFTNKTIDAELNTLSNVAVSPFAQNYKRIGFMVPSPTAAASLNQALEGMPSNGTFSFVNDATEGYVAQFNSSTLNDIIGYRSTTAIQLPTERTWNAYIKARVKISTTTSTRIFVGFTTLNQLTSSDTILASTDSGVLVGFRTTDTNISTFNNDGTAALVATSNAVAKDTGWHTLQVALSGTNAVTTVDASTPITVTTRLPATTTVIYANVVAQLGAAASTNFLIKGIVFRSDK